VKDQRWNQGGQLRTDEVEKRCFPTFELLVRQHNWEVHLNVTEAGVQVKSLTLPMGGHDKYGSIVGGHGGQDIGWGIGGARGEAVY
jgi:hypothetical protein